MAPGNRPLSTVERAVAVLRVLADVRDDLGNNEIARRTGINPSTVSRLLGTLAAEGMVHRVPDTGRFRLGPLLVELGNAALTSVDLHELARPHLVALTEATGETATLSVADDETVTTVDFVQSPLSVRSVAQLGRPSVTYATATGKVFLAHGGSVPDGPLRPFTNRTITDVDALAADLDRTRKRGWAQAVGEREDDLNAVACPILDTGDGLVAILGLQGPAARFGPRGMRAAAGRLVAHASRLTTPSR